MRKPYAWGLNLAGGLLGTAMLAACAGCGQSWATSNGPGRFITSLCAAGDTLWAATEDQGLWRHGLASGEWQQVEAGYDPLPASVYGVAVDARGRTWFGSLNQGVAVYNGRAFQTYGVMEGCGGERVFAVAADPDPARGDVWIATDHGLTRYTPGAGADGVWQTYTRRHGLPSDQVTAVAVGPAGRVWIGTECDGLGWADPPYDEWLRPVSVPQAEPAGPELGPPGIACDMINSLAVRADGTVAAGTPEGVAIGRNNATDWTTWQRSPPSAPQENYARGLAWDGAGGLWIATRHKGLARLDLETGKVETFQRPPRPKTEPGKPAPPAMPGLLPDNYATAVAITSDGSVWCGTYGGGVARRAGAAAVRAPGAAAPASGKAAAKEPPPLPKPAAPPEERELLAMLEQVRQVPTLPPERQPAALRLDDDWLTQGNWLGRYGRYWACLCAICSPGNYLWGAGEEPVAYHARIGPQARSGDSLRYWVHWLYTGNPNALEMPPTYFHSRVLKGFQTWEPCRRQAEWCDNGHEYPMKQAGPDLYCTLRIPAGQFYLSLYFNNKDGHMGNNRFRDYRLSVRRQPPGRDIGSIDGFDAWPELARGRIVDFWGGAYKRFLVRGPQALTVRVERNHSFNTVLMGAFLDAVDELPAPYYPAVPPGRWAGQAQAGQAGTEARLLEELERARDGNPAWWASSSRPMYAALARHEKARMSEQVARDAGQRAIMARAATCCYRLGLYAPWEAALTRAGITPSRQIEKALRWDGQQDCDGKGRQVVSEYVRTHSPTAPAAGPAESRP